VAAAASSDGAEPAFEHGQILSLDESGQPQFVQHYGEGRRPARRRRHVADAIDAPWRLRPRSGGPHCRGDKNT